MSRLASFTIPLSERVVFYITRSETLLKVDFIAYESCLANLNVIHIRRGKINWQGCGSKECKRFILDLVALIFIINVFLGNLMKKKLKKLSNSWSNQSAVQISKVLLVMYCMIFNFCLVGQNEILEMYCRLKFLFCLRKYKKCCCCL